MGEVGGSGSACLPGYNPGHAHTAPGGAQPSAATCHPALDYNLLWRCGRRNSVGAACLLDRTPISTTPCPFATAPALPPTPPALPCPHPLWVILTITPSLLNGHGTVNIGTTPHAYTGLLTPLKTFPPPPHP